MDSPELKRVKSVDPNCLDDLTTDFLCIVFRSERILLPRVC